MGSFLFLLYSSAFLAVRTLISKSMSSLLSGITCSPVGLQYRLAGSQRISVFVQDQDERVCHLRVTPQYLSHLPIMHGCLGHKAIFLVCEK